MAVIDSAIRIPSAAEQHQRDGTRRRKNLAGAIRRLGNRGHAQGTARYDAGDLGRRGV